MVAGMEINYDQLGKSFQPLRITNWKVYLREEKEKFYQRITQNEYPIAEKYNFLFLKLLGSGMFGNVLLTQNKLTQIYHAAKIIKKKKLLKPKFKQHITNEQKILMAIRFPFTVNLDYFFEDKICLYFIMPVALGGELFTYIEKVGELKEQSAKFYAAQIVLALEYLHFLDLIYRDLKPENILLDHKGYVKMTDFGFCKLSSRTYTLCGTPEYIAPEVLANHGYGKTVDWWAFGVFIYELLCGRSPFVDTYLENTYENILKGKYYMPKHFSPEVKHLITHLLQYDITKRYGNLKGGVEDIKKHKWFKSIVWLDILNRNVQPPFIPNINDLQDTSNFYYNTNQQTDVEKLKEEIQEKPSLIEDKQEIVAPTQLKVKKKREHIL